MPPTTSDRLTWCAQHNRKHRAQRDDARARAARLEQALRNLTRALDATYPPQPMSDPLSEACADARYVLRQNE